MCGFCGATSSPQRAPDAEECVRTIALEARKLGFRVAWADRSSGRPREVLADTKVSSLTCHLSHSSWSDGPIYLDFVPVVGRVQILGAHGSRRARSDVAASEAPAAVGRRLAAHVLRPLRGDEAGALTLAGLPSALTERVLEYATSVGARRVAATARALRVEATRDDLWRYFLRRDARLLDTEAPDGPVPSPVAPVYAMLFLSKARSAAAAAERAAERRIMARRLFEEDLLRLSPTFGPRAPAPAQPPFAPVDPRFAPRGPTWATGWGLGMGSDTW